MRLMPGRAAAIISILATCFLLDCGSAVQIDEGATSLTPEFFINSYGKPDQDSMGEEDISTGRISRTLDYGGRDLRVYLLRKRKGGPWWVTYSRISSRFELDSETAGTLLSGRSPQDQSAALAATEAEKAKRGCEVLRLAKGDKPISDLSYNDLKLLRACDALGF